MSEEVERWDVFISHAHEDNEAIARPLAFALRRRGLAVWYDEFSLRLGDSLRESIDRGLGKSRFGIVILSRDFIKKKWPAVELNALFGRQQTGDTRVLIPLWHEVTHREILEWSPLVADLVSVPTSLGLPQLVEKIIEITELKPPERDLSKVAPTGLPRLDRILGGGLPRRSSFVLQGPKGIGKTTLSMQFQMASLDRSEPCLYVSYREAPHDILARLSSLGAPIEAYVHRGRFRIFDNYSSLHGVSAAQVRQSVPNELRNAVIRVENPRDREEYFRHQAAVMDEMGTGGVNVIDSTNERYRLLPAGQPSDISANTYFNRFRAHLARHKGQTAVHIVSDDVDSGFDRVISDLQDGVIRMRFMEGGGGRRRELRVESMREACHDDNWYDFRITPSGVELL